MRKLALAGLAAVAALLMLTGVAGASTFTLGSTTQPSGSNAAMCNAGAIVAQTSAAAPVLATAPAGGQITQWQINTAGATAQTPISLVVLAPENGLYRIDAVDNQMVPNPAGGVATFTPASTMMISAGDILAVNGAVPCFWDQGGVPFGDQGNISVGLAPTAGEVISPQNGGQIAVNVAATVVATEDSAVATTVQPSAPTSGGLALLSSTVTDNGPAGNPLTFTDAVPTGLQIDTVVSPSGSCSTSGQVVTCTISGLTAGQSAPVYIVVTPRAGTYTNSVTVAQPSAATDPVTTNNTAADKFTVATATVTKCVVTSLANVPLSTAKKLLKTLNCKVGKVTKTSSSKVAKGNVIKTTPGSGSYALGKSIAIVESSGPKPKKPAKHKKK
jgi:hypothetical protein